MRAPSASEDRLQEEFEAWWQESFGNVTVVCPEELAEVLGKDRSAVYRAIKRGEIPAWRLGRSYLILKPGLWFWWKWLHLQEAEEY